MNYTGRSVALASAYFFLLGLAVVPVSHLGDPASSIVGAISFVVVAGITWYWFYHDASRHNVRPSVWWAIGLVWPVVSTIVFIAYLLRSRGLKGGAIATLVLLGFCVLCLGLLYAGASLAEAVYL